MILASKLKDHITKVEAIRKKMEDAAGQYLKFRIEFGTVVEKGLPTCKGRGSWEGKDLDYWLGVAAQCQDRLDNCAAWLGRFQDEMDVALRGLDRHLADYDPTALKKPGVLMDDERVTRREKLKEAGLGLSRDAKDLSKEISKMLNA